MSVSLVVGRQELLDRFYTKLGPCCAGWDWWHPVNTVAGECRRSAPVPGEQRIAMLGMRSTSRLIPAGHVMTASCFSGLASAS